WREGCVRTSPRRQCRPRGGRCDRHGGCFRLPRASAVNGGCGGAAGCADISDFRFQTSDLLSDFGFLGFGRADVPCGASELRSYRVRRRGKDSSQLVRLAQQSTAGSTFPKGAPFISSQNRDSSLSSSTCPIFAANSASDRERQTAR